MCQLKKCHTSHRYAGPGLEYQNSAPQWTTASNTRHSRDARAKCLWLLFFGTSRAPEDLPDPGFSPASSPEHTKIWAIVRANHSFGNSSFSGKAEWSSPSPRPLQGAYTWKRGNFLTRPRPPVSETNNLYSHKQRDEFPRRYGRPHPLVLR